MTKIQPFDPPCSAPNTIQPRDLRLKYGRLVCMEVCLVELIPIVCAFGIALLLSYVLDLHFDCYHISTPHLKIDSITVSNFNLSSRPNQISADWNIKMNLKSTGGHGYLNFDDISVSIYYNELQIGLTSLMPFDITPHNSTNSFDKKFTGSSGLCDDSIISAINTNIAAGTVTLHVQFKASVRKSFKGRWVDHRGLVVDCKNVELFFGSSNKSRAQMLNPSHKCQVVGYVT